MANANKLKTIAKEAVNLSQTMDSFEDLLNLLSQDIKKGEYVVYRIIPRRSNRTYYIAGPQGMYSADIEKLIEEEQQKSFEELGWTVRDNWICPMKVEQTKKLSIGTGPKMGENLYNAAQRVDKPTILVCDKWPPA